MEQAEISVPVGLGKLVLPAEEAARILVASILQPAPVIITRKAIPALGDYWEEQGGIYVGYARGHGIPDYPLIVAAGDEGQQAELEWGGRGEEEPGATSEWDGKANTAALVASEHAHPAAEWAAGLSITAIGGGVMLSTKVGTIYQQEFGQAFLTYLDSAIAAAETEPRHE